MKQIFIAGSRKFYAQIEELAKQLKAAGIKGLTPKKQLGDNDFEHEKEALLRAFNLIDKADMVYVVAEKGYVGKTVVIEMAYAYAKGKLIYASEEIVEFSARALVNKIVTQKNLLEMK